MAYNRNAKLKTLYIRQILEDETDAEHGLSMRQIIERLADYGIEAERKSIYRDIETLREFGVDIRTYQRNPVEYAIERRNFALDELMLLVDAVESCKSLTRRQSNALIANLKTFASDHQRALLDRRIHVEGRITSKNDSVFGSIDSIHQAMYARKKIEFVYYRYDLEGKRCATREGKPHQVTPVFISYEGGYYYLTAWNSEHGSMAEYRIDRMGKLRIMDSPADRDEEISRYGADGDSYARFGRFLGDPVTATLLVDGDKVEIILDRFGEEVQLSKEDESHARAIVKVHKSEQFFGWLAGLGKTVSLIGPKHLCREYKDYLLSLVDGMDA